MITQELLLGSELSGGERLRERQSAILKKSRMVHTLDVVGKLEGHEGCVNSVSFSKEDGGARIVTGSDDCTVKVWDVHTRRCLKTLYGPTSNVFAAHFVPHKGCAEIIAAGNDGDIWHYDINRDYAMRYSVHSRKVLSMSFCPNMPAVFLSSSGDGTVRMTDLRMKQDVTVRSYNKISDMRPCDEAVDGADVVQQALGGGRFQAIESIESQPGSALCVTFRDYSFANRANMSLVLSYRRCPGLPAVPALYSVEFHPIDTYAFIVASEGDGCVRRFDLRSIRDAMPASYTNIYRNVADKDSSFTTGCTFSARGDLVAASYVGCRSIYCFDAEAHFPDARYGPNVRKKMRVSRDVLTMCEPMEDDMPMFDNNYGVLRNETAIERLVRVMSADEQESSRRSRRRHGQRRSLTWVETSIAAAQPHCSLCGKECSGLYMVCKDCGDDGTICVECYISGEVSDKHDATHDNVHIAQPAGDDEARSSEENIECYHIRYSLDDNDDGGDDDDDGGDNAQLREERLEHIKEIIRARMGIRLYYEAREICAEKIVPAGPLAEGNDNNNGEQTYYMSYKGHVTRSTSKGCTFLGPNSEYLASGSDDCMVYIWERETGALVRALVGHEEIVNSVVQQPCGGTVLATSGLEDHVCLWDSVGRMPTQDEIDEYIDNLKAEIFFRDDSRGIIDMSTCHLQ